MNRSDAIAYLDSHIGLGMQPGLDRITALLDLMGNPERTYPSIHVAGTNGKTSVSRIATLACVAHGLTTGTYTSPHLEQFEERIALNGIAASEDQLIQAVLDVKAFADIFERDGNLTYFELVTALAFSWFADQAVNTAVIEVGLGGRLDATNVIESDVAVVTSIGLDHTEILGDTLEKIAVEKLAILSPETCLVVGPLPEEVLKLARRTAAERGARIYEYGKDFRVEGSAPGVGGRQVDIEGIHGTYQDLFLPLHGRHQTINLAVAVAATEALLERRLDASALADGISVVTSPGRLERFGEDRLVLLDGAHNADGFAVLASALDEEYPSLRWVLVVGAMMDKDLTTMLPKLADRVVSVVATTIDSERAVPADRLAALASNLLGVRAEAVPDPVAAVEHAKQIAGEGGSVLVTGSLYLVGTVRSHLRAGAKPDRNERLTGGGGNGGAAE